MKRLRKILLLSHRYVGIAISALVVMWFVTGITMMYVGGMPRVTPELRLERMTAVNPAEVRLTPAEAAERAEFGQAPARATLLSILGRPAYRFGGNGGTTIVYADNGEIADEFSDTQTRDIAARFIVTKLWSFFAYPNPAPGLVQELSDVAVPESMPRMEGNQMHTILSRRPQTGGKAKAAAAAAR